MEKDVVNKKNVNNKSSKKKSNKKKILILSSVITLVVLAVVYLSVSVYFQYHFLKGTYINGIDCSFKTVDEVENIFADEARTYYLQIIQRNNTVEHVTAEDIKLTMAVEGDISEFLESQNSYAWLFNSGEEFELETDIAYDTNALNARFNTLNCLDTEKMTDATAPEITYIDGAYKVGTGNPGTRLDTEKLKTLITAAVSNMRKEINLEKEECYLVANNTDDSKYTELLNTLNKCVNTKITLTFNDELEPVIIDGSKISTWMSVDADLNIVFDMTAVESFVSELSKEIETMGQSRTFKNSYGNEVKVSGGDYGWWVSEGKEAEAIVNDIKNGTDVERELNYLQKAASYGETDFGNTYIEINLMKQHLFCYKDGTLITECDIISGSNANPTPTGIYKMRFMFTNYTFNRANFQRTVPYWMVFYGDDADSNIGLIGCDFRTDFGGTTYLYNGSDGSVYVPMDSATIIYNQIPNDIPVIIYKAP